MLVFLIACDEDNPKLPLEWRREVVTCATDGFARWDGPDDPVAVQMWAEALDGDGNTARHYIAISFSRATDSDDWIIPCYWNELEIVYAVEAEED